MRLIKIIKRLMILLIVFGLLYLTYDAYFVSPKAYQITQYSYQNSSINSQLNGLDIAFISDINLNNSDDLTKLEKAISDLNKQSCDIVIFGGDLFDGDIFETNTISKLLKTINSQYGKFAILGDKDESNSTEITQILNNGGFEVLTNEVRTIYYNDTSFALIASQMGQDISSFDIKTSTITVDITHQPDSFKNNKDYIDLQLSGHSYGGSVYIPYLGALITQEGSKTYNHGRYDETSTLIVSNGFSGPHSFPYKLFADNEILIVTLNTATLEKES